MTAREEVRELDKQLKNVNQQLGIFTKERDSAHQDVRFFFAVKFWEFSKKQELVKDRTKLNLKVKDAKTKLDNHKQQDVIWKISEIS